MEFLFSAWGLAIYTIRPEPGRVYRVIGLDHAMEQAELTRRWLQNPKSERPKLIRFPSRAF
jgi:hypothetical protein